MASTNALEGQNSVIDATYLNYLPDHLRSRYLEGLVDSQLTHLRKSIALMDVRIKILLESLDRQILTTDKIASDIRAEFEDIDPAMADKLAVYLQTYLPEGHIDQRTYLSLERLVNKYLNAMAEKGLTRADQALRQLFESIRLGRRDDAIWQEIEAVMDSRRKLVEAEERRLVQNRQMMKFDAVVAINLAIIQSVKEVIVRHVPDRETQQYILTEAERAFSAALIGTVDLDADQISVE